MDDDYTPGGGSHILASVSRVRVAKRKMLPIVIVHAPKPMWGFTYTKHPRVGEPKFAIVDEVRFTALCLIVAGVVAGQKKNNTRTNGAIRPGWPSPRSRPSSYVVCLCAHPFPSCCVRLFCFLCCSCQWSVSWLPILA